MHSLVSEQVHKYCEQHTTPEHTYLQQLHRATYITTQLPHMVSGHLQGAFLQMISSMIQPQCILEIGTFTGYSAICLAKGLTANGTLITIDVNEELQDICLEYFEKNNVAHQIEMRIGNAIDIISTIHKTFDIVFIDADKINYSNYFDLVIDKVTPGGYIIADNVLYSSEVLDDKKSKNAKAMDAYNKKVNADARVECMLLPLRDGLMLCRKK